MSTRDADLRTRLLILTSGMGRHGEDCVFPDTPCSCGLAEFRQDARAQLARALDADSRPPADTDTGRGQ